MFQEDACWRKESPDILGKQLLAGFLRSKQDKAQMRWPEIGIYLTELIKYAVFEYHGTICVQPS